MFFSKKEKKKRGLFQYSGLSFDRVPDNYQFSKQFNRILKKKDCSVRSQRTQ